MHKTLKECEEILKGGSFQYKTFTEMLEVLLNVNTFHFSMA